MNRTAARRFAPTPLAAGLVMLAISATAFANRLDINLNMTVAAGCAAVLAGTIWMAVAIARVRRAAASSSEPSTS